MPKTIDKRAQRSVRAYDADIAVINDMAEELGCSAADVIHTIFAAFKRRQYKKEVAETFKFINAQESLKTQLLAEQADWDMTLGDGL